jgi:hypothetical protein
VSQYPVVHARDGLPPNYPAQRVALVDLLDRVLAEGVVITGEITLSIADVDLVTVSLRALLASVSALAGQPPGQGGQTPVRGEVTPA